MRKPFPCSKIILNAEKGRILESNSIKLFEAADLEAGAPCLQNTNNSAERDDIPPVAVTRSKPHSSICMYPMKGHKNV